MKRILYLVIDQLPGHWVEGVIADEGYPPVNVWGYYKLGLIPNFSYLINNGIFVFTWNRGICDTPHGMKYLATGMYNAGPYITPKKETGVYYPRTLDNPGPVGFFEYAKHYAPEKIMAASFTTDYWIAPGYFWTAQEPIALPASYPDELIWRDFALPYLRRKIPNWNLVYIYFPVNDTVSFCPSYQKTNPHPRSSKHAYILYLDSLLAEILEYLKGNRLWEETYFIIASDHGYHAGCSTARKYGAKNANLCCDHPAPYDCEVWDFEKDCSTGIKSDCTRRTTCIISGGALESEYRGTIVKDAEIIDIIPTIAELIEIPYKCEGKSIFSYKAEKLDNL